MADFSLPKNFAIHSEGGDPKGIIEQRRKKDPLAVAGRGGGGMGIVFVLPQETAPGNFRLPEQLSRVALVAEHGLNARRFVRRGDEDAIAPDRG